MYKAFFLTINNLGLQRYWLAAKCHTIKKAVEIDKAYYQGDGLHRPDQVIEEEKGTDRPLAPQIAADLRDHTAYPILRPGHFPTSLQDCPKRL